MKILIIRHGEPDYAHDSLTEKGFREAELLSQRLIHANIREIYCSPLGRAQATARPTAEKYGIEPIILPWLREFAGKRVDENGNCMIPWNLEPRYWTTHPELFRMDTWTQNTQMRAGTAEEVYQQTVTALDALLAEHGYRREGMIYHCERNGDETIALFCHFAMGMVLISHLTGISPVLLWQGLFLPTSSVTTLITEERVAGEVMFKCMQVGDTSHLYAKGEPVSHQGLFAERFGQTESGAEA